MAAYYNEHDALKAEVLREAIRAGAIAPGDVDERSIADVRGSDLAGYTQCHFFAGGGFWSLALRWAGWPDSRPAWTGSCPCPSFSCAGKGGGFDDPRHLWPHWARLIGECKPPVVFGEQADDAVGYGWADLVQTDLEAQAYAFGKVVFGAHSVGAPHIRQRLYFVADTGHRDESDGCELAGEAVSAGGEVGKQWIRSESSAGGDFGELADTDRAGSQVGRAEVGGADEFRAGLGFGSALAQSCPAGELEYPASEGRIERRPQPGERRAVGGCGTGSVDNSIADGWGARRGDYAIDERQFDYTAGLALRMGEPIRAGLQRLAGDGGDGHEPGREREDAAGPVAATGESSELADAGYAQRVGRKDERQPGSLDANQRSQATVDDQRCSDIEPLADADGGNAGAERQQRGGQQRLLTQDGGAGPLRGFWADADWIPCRNPKIPGGVEWRPAQPGTFPLAHGYPNRVGILRLAGDAIVVSQAQAWIETYLEARGLKNA